MLSFNQRRSNFVRKADSVTFSTLCADVDELTDMAEASTSQRKRGRACTLWSEAATTVEAEADKRMDSERASSGHHMEAAASGVHRVRWIDGSAGGASAVSVDVVMVPVHTSGQDVQCFAGGEQERTVAGRVEAANSSGNARTFGDGEEHFLLTA